MRLSLPVSLISALLAASPSFAEGFDTTTQINTTTLSNTIAASQVNIMVTDSAVFTSNNAVSDAFQGNTGVVGIVQNSGVASNVQQSINVQIGSVSFQPDSNH